MIGLLVHNFRIILPTYLWTGILSSVLLGLVLFFQLRRQGDFTNVDAASLGEGLIPLVAAFLAAGVMDPELRRGAHEVLQARRAPLWHSVASRLFISIVTAVVAGGLLLAVLYLTLRRFPIGIILAASVPGAFVMAAVSLWMRVRLGNVFIGYIVALAIWLANVFTGAIGTALGIHVNPLLNFASYTDRLQAATTGKLTTTAYVDWWWVSKLALCLAGLLVCASMTRRLERLAEGD